MSLDRRRRLLELAARWHVPILEDDPYSELRYEGDVLPSLKALDEHEQVLYLSTFSKVVLPGLRIGYFVVPTVVLRQLVQAKQSADLHSNSFGQYLLERFVRDGYFSSHVERLKAAYRRRRDAMASALCQEESLELRFDLPSGGFYIWCKLPDGIEQSTLMAHAASRGVSFLPGRACFAADPPENAIRLNFTHCSEELIGEGVERLRDALRETARVRRRRVDGVATSPIV